MTVQRGMRLLPALLPLSTPHQAQGLIQFPLLARLSRVIFWVELWLRIQCEWCACCIVRPRWEWCVSEQVLQLLGLGGSRPHAR